MVHDHSPTTQAEIIQYLYLLRYFGRSLEDIYPLYPHPPPPRRKHPVAGILDALAAACTLEAEQETAIAIIQEPGRTTLCVSQTGTISNRLQSHLERLWLLLRRCRASYFDSSIESEDRRCNLLKQVYRLLYRACFRPCRTSPRDEEASYTFARVMGSAENVPRKSNLTYILRVIEAQSSFNANWDDDTLDEFITSHSGIHLDLADAPFWTWEKMYKSLLRDQQEVPSYVSSFSLKTLCDRVLWFYNQVQCLISFAEPKGLHNRLHTFLDIPLHIVAISSHPSISSCLSVDVSIDTLLPLLNRELDPSAIPFTVEQVQHRRDYAFPEMSNIDSVSFSGISPHPELTLLSYLHHHSREAYPYLGLSRPCCYACYRLFDAYNVKVNSNEESPYVLDGPDPVFRLPCVFPTYLLSEDFSGLNSSEREHESVGILKGPMWEHFAKTVKQDVRDLWRRAVIREGVTHFHSEMLARLGKERVDRNEEEEAIEGIESMMRALRAEQVPQVSVQASS